MLCKEIGIDDRAVSLGVSLDKRIGKYGISQVGHLKVHVCQKIQEHYLHLSKKEDGHQTCLK